MLPAPGSWARAPLQVPAEPRLLQGHLLRDIVTQPSLLCQPRGLSSGPHKGHILPPSLHGDAFWGGLPRARSKAKEESPPSPALAAPAAPELSPLTPEPG